MHFYRSTDEEIIVTTFTKLVMYYFAGVMNCGHSIYCGDQSTTFNHDRVTGTTPATAPSVEEHSSLTSFSLAAGTSLLLPASYSNGDQSSTSFRQLEKVFFHNYSCTLSLKKTSNFVTAHIFAKN